MGVVGALAQTLGVLMASVGGALLWSPWALVIGGVVLVGAVEAAEWVRPE